MISAYADASQIRPRHHRQCTLNIPDGVVGRRGSTGCDRVNSAGRAVGIGCRAQCHLRRQCVGVLVIDKAIVVEGIRREVRAASAAYRQSTEAKLGTEAKTSGMDARYSKNTIRFFRNALVQCNQFACASRAAT